MACAVQLPDGTCVNLRANSVDALYAQLYGLGLGNGWLALNGLPVQHTDLSEVSTVTFSWRGRLRGGKGAFGQQLKEEGERMSRKKKEVRNERDLDTFRTSSGQRLQTVRQAKLLAKYNPKMEKQKTENPKRSRRARSTATTTARGPAAATESGPGSVPKPVFRPPKTAVTFNISLKGHPSQKLRSRLPDQTVDSFFQ